MRVTRPIATRVAVDILLTHLGLLLAFTIRYIVVMLGRADADVAHRLFYAYTRQYALTSWILSLLVLGIFSAFGIYRRVRAYRRRFKALAVVQATTVAHLVFGFGLYLLRSWLAVPSGVLILSCLLCIVLLAGVRLAHSAFQAFDRFEQRLAREAPSDQPQHILVIGGAGYIGSLLLRRLLAEGYRVRLVDALMYGDGAIKELYGHPQFEFIRGDFRHINTVVQALHGMDAVFHLGAIVGDPACAIDEDFSTEINLIATRMLAEACKGYGIRRFIFASTCSVYGASNEVLEERSELHPVSLYAQTKIDSERELLNMADNVFAPTVLRLATIYGLSPRPRFDLVVNLLTAKAVREGKITIFGGDQWRPFVHVADAAEAMLLTLRAPLMLVKGEIFNVGSDEQNYTIRQIGQLIQRLIPSAELVEQGEDVDKRNYHVSFAKIARQLHFKPRYTVEDGVQEIRAALERGEIRDYGDRAFNNHKFLVAEDNAALLRLESPWAKRPSIT